MASLKPPRARNSGSTSHIHVTFFQKKLSVTDWGLMALDSSKEFQKLCELLAMTPEIRMMPDCPDFPFWEDWMSFSYYIYEIKSWSASNPEKATPIFIKLKEINDQTHPKIKPAKLTKSTKPTKPTKSAKSTKVKPSKLKIKPETPPKPLQKKRKRLSSND